MLPVLLFAALVGSSMQAGLLMDAMLPGGHLPIDPMASPEKSTPYQKPWFCHQLDCPRFTVLESNDKYEVRRYEPSIWVATKISTMLYAKEQSMAMFYKLFHYISGNNTKNKHIDMTAPVVTEIEHGQGPDCESNFTMHFMLPFALQNDPPAPTDTGVFIRNVPEATVIVKQYSGYPNDQIRREKLEEFIGDIDAANKQYYDNIFYTAGYDGPYTFTERHNELWVLQK